MTATDVHIDPVLSPADDESEPIRHGLRHAQRIVLRAEQAGDEGQWAPTHGKMRCTDRTGFRRRFHSWDRDGRCVFCSVRRPWEPL